MRRLGAGRPVARACSPMDRGSSKAAIVETFVRCTSRGLIYRGQRLVNWDLVLTPRLRPGSGERGRWNATCGRSAIRWPMARRSNTRSRCRRVEMMRNRRRGRRRRSPKPSSAIPRDGASGRSRYLALIGRVRSSATSRRIPVIADDYVDRDFGTGVVKVTPRMTSTTTPSAGATGLPMINI